MKKKISIIIPVYNAEKYLEQCLNSVVKQELNNFEIVCVNDGSTDNSLNILTKYAKKYKFIKVINQENKGVIQARITGYNNSEGKYIGWVDSDDFVNLDMFKKMYDNAENNKSDVVICNYNFFPSEVYNKKKWFNKYYGVVDWKFIHKNTVQWNKIIRKKLLDDMKITELFKIMGEGSYSLILIQAKKISVIDEPLYNYRVGHVSLSSNFKDLSWYKETIRRNANKLSYVKEKKYSTDWIEYFKYVYLYYVLILLIVSVYNGDYKEYTKSQNILKIEGLFENKYRIYLKNDFSNIKILFFKYIGINSYYIMRIVTKLILR